MIAMSSKPWVFRAPIVKVRRGNPGCRLKSGPFDPRAVLVYHHQPVEDPGKEAASAKPERTIVKRHVAAPMHRSHDRNRDDRGIRACGAMYEKHISCRDRCSSMSGESSATTAIRVLSAGCQTLPAPAAGPRRATFRARHCRLSLGSERPRSRPAARRRSSLRRRSLSQLNCPPLCSPIDLSPRSSIGRNHIPLEFLWEENLRECFRMFWVNWEVATVMSQVRAMTHHCCNLPVDPKTFENIPRQIFFP